eukprot:s1435_g4.t1
MSRSRFLEQIGVPHDQATTAGFNRFRRFMPTLGNTLRLDPPEMQAIGSWVEIPASGGPQPTTKSRAVWLMSRHYAGGQADRSAAVKIAILDRFWQLYRRKQADLALSHDHLLPRGSWSWQELAAANEAMPALEIKLPEAPTVVVEDASALAATEAPAALDGPLVVEGEHGDDSSSTTSSSASDETARGSDVEGVVPVETADQVRWFKQGSKVHLVHHLDDANRMVPWCRDTSFQQDAKSDGYGFSTSSRQTFCQRCLARLPRGVYTAALQLSGTLLVMTTAAKIDVLEDDRGLRSCFEAANVQVEWRKAFMATHKIETLDDFIYLVEGDKWEPSLRDLLEAIAELRGNRLILARFKAAYESGLAAVKASQAAPKTEDLSDQVLPEATLQSVTVAFRKKYGLVLDSYVDPSDSLRSRCYREFRRGQMSLLEARRIKSMMNITVPKTQDNIKLSASVQMQLQEDETITITSAIEYYLQLRTLANAWAWAGQFETQDYDGTRKTFLTLEDALNYADFALRSAAEYGHSSLQWLMRNDLLTRSKMASLIRRGYTGGSALAEALRQTHIEWRSPAIQYFGSAAKTGRSAPPPEPPEAPMPKRPCQIKSDTVQTVSMVKGGRKLCKLWNDNRGCRGCGDLHQCDVRLANGQACVRDDAAPAVAPRRVVVQPLDNMVRAESPPPSKAQPRAVTFGGPGTPAEHCLTVGSTLQDNALGSPAGLSERLAAAKPVVWRGRSDLQQFPWANQPFKGTWLILDLWGGFAGLPIACLTLGVHFYALSAESDPEARACAAQAMPNIVHIDAVEKIQATPAAVERFHADHRRFPPGAYEEHSLLWKGDAWRTLSPAECSQLMGTPHAATAAIQGPPNQRRAKQNSLLCNGFHIPSLLVVLMLLPQLLESKLLPSPPSPDGALRARLQHTVWEPGRLAAMPDLYTAPAIIQEMQLMLPMDAIPKEVWMDSTRRLQACRLHQLQMFAAWRRLRGESWTSLGPTPIFGRDRTRIFAGVTGQRYAATGPRAPSPAGSMAASAEMPSPFTPHDWPEPDVLFVVECIYAWREAMPALAAEQRHILKTVARARPTGEGPRLLSHCCSTPSGCLQVPSICGLPHCAFALA